MELFQLRYFAAAARHLHFTRAAAECFVAQPSLSQQIAKLEREVGTALFLRQGRSVRLTDAGEALLVYAERILADEAAARPVPIPAKIVRRVSLRDMFPPDVCF